MTKGQNFTPIGTTDAINSTISINHGAGKPPPFPPPFLKHNFASQGSPIDTQILFYGIFRVLHNISHIYDPFSRFPPPFPPPFLPYSKSSGKTLNFLYLKVVIPEVVTRSRSSRSRSRSVAVGNSDRGFAVRGLNDDRDRQKTVVTTAISTADRDDPDRGRGRGLTIAVRGRGLSRSKFGPRYYLWHLYYNYIYLKLYILYKKSVFPCFQS